MGVDDGISIVVKSVEDKAAIIAGVVVSRRA
jgi:hypothetical protein